jgi:hypothetical protein
MEPVLIAIGGLGLLGLLGVVLLAKRIARLDVHLARLERLDEIDRRLRDLSAEFDRKELNSQLQSKMTEVTEANRRLAHALGQVRDEVAALRDNLRGAADQPSATPAGGPADVNQLVRGHLSGTGFEDVHILSDLNRLEGRSGRVVFEGRRGGVMHKGHVNLKDGLVVDENVRAAYAAFP